MGYTAHLLAILISCFVVFCEAKYFPKARNFAEKSSIKASSTCGEIEMTYCDAKTLSSTPCTNKICKYACCPTCSNVSPNSNKLADGRKISIYDGKPRPGSTENSLGFDEQKGSYIDIRKLDSVDHQTKGFSICLWVNQTTGNRGYVTMF